MFRLEVYVDSFGIHEPLGLEELIQEVVGNVSFGDEGTFDIVLWPYLGTVAHDWV